MSRNEARGGNDRYDTLGNALVTAIRNTTRDESALNPVPEGVRIDGKVCLVTGANRGLGKAVAVELARRGGRVIMACRNGHPEAGEEVKRRSGSGAVEMFAVDLSDLRSVHQLCDELKAQDIGVDITVLNAGLATLRARRTRQGFETMFAVHFLANRVIVDRWLKDGLLRPSGAIGDTPRIVLVASETHRSSDPIDFESVLWAGPETLSRGVKRGDCLVQGGPRKRPAGLRFGFCGEDFSYAIDFGLPTPSRTMFNRDPEIKREVIWRGEMWHDRREEWRRARPGRGRRGCPDRRG